MRWRLRPDGRVQVRGGSRGYSAPRAAIGLYSVMRTNSIYRNSSYMTKLQVVSSYKCR